MGMLKRKCMKWGNFYAREVFTDLYSPNFVNLHTSLSKLVQINF